MRARVVRHATGGNQRLPTRALAVEGGGPWVTEPGDGEGLKTRERLFEVELDLGERPPGARLGTRAWVKFRLANEPLGWQAWRRLRQAFLGQVGP